jgi:hypothetical protein
MWSIDGGDDSSEDDPANWSPPFFSVNVFPEDKDKWPLVHDGLRRMITEKF